MKILFITTKCPLPINDGHSLRTYNLLRYVAEKHEIYLLSYVKYSNEYNYKDQLLEICKFVTMVKVSENISRFNMWCSVLLNLFSTLPFVAMKYNSYAMRNEIIKYMKEGDFDLVHLDMLPLGVFLDDIRLPVLLNEHNVESALLKRRVESTTNVLSKTYFYMQQKRLERFEKRVISRVNVVAVCSEEDHALVNKLVPGKNIRVVPNGVDVDYYRSSGTVQNETSRLAFVGGMNWFPNKDAVIWFDQIILPILLQSEPTVILDVIGKPDKNLQIRNVQNVNILGFVDDVRSYLERVSVVVVPIRTGGGTRLKVLEAMSMGKAIVSTTVGVEGIRAEHRRHVIIADTPDEFACSVAELLSNEDLRRDLGCAARNLVCNDYQWDSIGNRLLNAYDSMFEATS